MSTPDQVTWRSAQKFVRLGSDQADASRATSLVLSTHLKRWEDDLQVAPLLLLPPAITCEVTDHREIQSQVRLANLTCDAITFAPGEHANPPRVEVSMDHLFKMVDEFLARHQVAPTHLFLPPFHHVKSQVASLLSLDLTGFYFGPLRSETFAQLEIVYNAPRLAVGIL